MLMALRAPVVGEMVNASPTRLALRKPDTFRLENWPAAIRGIFADHAHAAGPFISLALPLARAAYPSVRDMYSDLAKGPVQTLPRFPHLCCFRSSRRVPTLRIGSCPVSKQHQLLDCGLRWTGL